MSMLKVKDTPNHLGAYISGTFDDLDTLYDAVYDVMGPPGEEPAVSGDGEALRVLGVLYEIRHAYMGMRGIDRCFNGVDHQSMEFEDKELPERNVEFSVPLMWPELAYFTLVIDDMAVKAIEHPKKLYRGIDKAVYEAVGERLESSIGLVKLFVSLVWLEMQRLIGKRRMARIHRNAVYGPDYGIEQIRPDMYPQYIDMLNIRYGNMKPEKRPQELGKIVRCLMDPFSDHKYNWMIRDIRTAAFQYDVDESEVDLFSNQYPEVMEW